jgi:hypothetical protein
MITVNISRSSKNNKIMEFEISGHAGYDEYGRDIVCSAVSILAQTAVIGLVEYVRIDCTYEIEDGYLYCKLPEHCSEQQQVKIDSILETMVLGIENIKNGYESYVSIEYKEV